MVTFLICVFGTVGIACIVKGMLDILMCAPYLPDRFAESKDKLIRGLIMFLVPVGIILLMLYDLMTIGT